LRFLLLFVFISYHLSGQILKDQTAKNLIIEGLDKAYNFEFAAADEIYSKINARFPANPAFATLMQMKLYTQFAPIKDNPKAKAQYLFYLNKSIELSEKMIQKNDKDPEGIFFMLSSLGNLAAWQADNDEMMKAVNTARKAFSFMKKGMKLTEVQADFLFTTGLYNYYIEQYPQDHPLVKPFMIFFSDGNKKIGLQQLELCAKKAVFTAVEANYYNCYINLKHETKPDKALGLISQISAKYPNNLIFKTKHAEALIALGKYEQAQPIVTDLIKAGGHLYGVAGNILQGLLEEKWKRNDIEALNYYKKGLKIPFDIRYTQDFHAMAWVGLGRLALRENKKNIAKDHFKTALKISQYQSTTREAEKYLKDL
jgi:tetratricopeptide (TPR) repeat protein